MLNRSLQQKRFELTLPRSRFVEFCRITNPHPSWREDCCIDNNVNRQPRHRQGKLLAERGWTVDARQKKSGAARFEVFPSIAEQIAASSRLVACATLPQTHASGRSMVNASEPALRDLVRGALLSGCRQMGSFCQTTTFH
jgi:hypothetical protein